MLMPSKVFRQVNLPERPKITRVDTPTGRYYTLQGKDYSVPSITSVLSATQDSTWLEEWKDKVGGEVAERTSRMASKQGTQMHLLCETYLTNGDLKSVAKTCLTQVVGRFKKLVPILDKIEVVLAAELMMVSDIVAGTADLFCVIDGQVCVVDYKTSKRIKTRDDIHSYFIQLAAYAYMFEYMYQIPVKRGIIIMSVENSTPLVFSESISSWTPELFKAIDQYEKIVKGIPSETE